MTSEKFQQAYQKLNPAQKEAVDTIEGPVLVAAGPGTGKTQILALRIANILLQTQVGPDNILALTFTSSGVIAMRRRLAELIGTPAYRVKIATFHSFCEEIIKGYPEHFPAIIGATHIDEVGQFKLLEEIIGVLPLLRLKILGNEFFYLKAINGSISKLKREGISPSELNKFVETKLVEFEQREDLYHTKGRWVGQMKGAASEEKKMLEKLRELSLVYENYQQRLRADKRYDYNDMILEVKEALLADNELLLILQEQYQYIVVDEHQDTNNAQNKVLEALASFYDQPNLFVVGDEKQAIFKFQGASLENFLYFRQKYPEAKLIALEENYRSGQLILDLAHSLLAGEKRLLAKGRSAKLGRISLAEFSTEAAELYYLAQDIKNKIKAGTAPEEIAVFVRDNKDAWPIADILGRLGVPFAVESNQDLLVDQEIRKLILLLRAVQAFGDEGLFLEFLHLDFLQVAPLDIYRLSVRASEYDTKGQRTGVFNLLRDPAQLAELKLLNPDRIISAFEILSKLKTRSKNLPLLPFFETAVRESGLLTDFLAGANALDNIAKINGFFAEVKKIVEQKKEAKLVDLIDYLRRLEDHDLSIKKLAGAGLAAAGKVRIMTAHRSKGLEFDQVYIAFAADGRWGNKRNNDRIKLPPDLFSELGAEDSDGEERRLFYVALTRARQALSISFSRERSDGKEQSASVFLTEINPDLIEKVDTAPIEEELIARPEIFFSTSLETIAPGREEVASLVRELFEKNGLAVTHLNNYLRCPWNYFYTNLLHLPQAPTASQMYGIAVHSALKDFFDRFKEADPGLEFLLTKYADYLNRQPLAENDYAEWKTRGGEYLAGYYNFSHEHWIRRTVTEKKISGVVLTDQIRLKGDIDKIEFLSDKRISVVDYKTSKPKTRGQIEGTVKDGDGDIKRQLVFYKLLLDLNEPGRYQLETAAVEFLRPNDKGRYVREEFKIEESEVEALVEQIKQVADEIINLKFWDRTCDKKDCPYCRLRGLLA